MNGFTLDVVFSDWLVSFKPGSTLPSFSWLSHIPLYGQTTFVYPFSNYQTSGLLPIESSHPQPLGSTAFDEEDGDHVASGVWRSHCTFTS